MPLTVREAMALKTFEHLQLVAGSKGLDTSIEQTAILDYEFSSAVSEAYPRQFTAGDFVLSSLFNTCRDEDGLLETVQKLIDLNVSALAIKTVFVKTLPKAVVQLADAEGFPIFLFDNSTYFEAIIVELTDALRTLRQLAYFEAQIETLMHGSLSPDAHRDIVYTLNRRFQSHVVAFYARSSSDTFDPRRLTGAYARSSDKAPSSALFCYKGGVLLLLSKSTDRFSAYRHAFDDALIQMGLSPDTLSVGASGVVETFHALSLAIREAVWAQMAAKGAATVTAFKDIGLYKLLLPHRDSLWFGSYQAQYMAPLLAHDAENGTELVKTALKYIESGGDLKVAAQKLYVHENTVRYRIKTIHERLCPEAGAWTFYEELSIAIRLYALIELNICL
ncbi:PucR family transcriptional regulator [Fusibacter sp. JL298sf-3]